MADTSTKVFVYEAMGRQRRLARRRGRARRRVAGRGAAADPVPRAALRRGGLPRARWRRWSARVGYCVVVASEGMRDADGRYVADAGGGKDAFGHTQLGGVASLPRRPGQGRARAQGALGAARLPAALGAAPRLGHRPRAGAGGRHARRSASRSRGMNATMPVIRRTSSAPYGWEIVAAPLERDRQQREEDAARLHPRRRLRHHRRPRGATSSR